MVCKKFMVCANSLMQLTMNRPPRFSNGAVAYTSSYFYPFEELDLHSVTELNSWGDRNYYFKGRYVGAKYTEFVLKIYNCEDSSNSSFIRGLADVMEYLHDNGYNCCFPLKARNKRNMLIFSEKTITEITDGNLSNPPTYCTNNDGFVYSKNDTVVKRQYCVLILYYVPGQIAAKVFKTDKLLFNISYYFGSLNKALQTFKHKDIMERKYLKFDLKYLPHIRQYLSSIQDSNRKAVYTKCIDDFETYVLSMYSELSHGIIHNDGNLMNIVLKNDEEVNGVIDFGDCVYSCHIFELGIIVLESTGHQFQPSSVKSVLSGYLKSFPLPEKDLDLLYYVVFARLAQICINGEHTYNSDTKNHYILNILQHSWKLTESLLKVSKNDFDSLWKNRLN